MLVQSPEHSAWFSRTLHYGPHLAVYQNIEFAGCAQESGMNVGFAGSSGFSVGRAPSPGSLRFTGIERRRGATTVIGSLRVPRSERVSKIEQTWTESVA